MLEHTAQALGALDKLPDEALQLFLDNCEQNSRRMAAEQGASSSAAADHLRWQALSSALRMGGVSASAKVREEVRRWHLSQEVAPAVVRSTASHKLAVRPGRLAIGGLALWSAFAMYRTAGDHELAGVDFYQWSTDDLVTNLVGVPAAAVAIYLVGKWTLGRSSGLKLGRWRFGLKRPRELPLLERVLHLMIYPVVLVPIGLVITIQGISEGNAAWVAMGLLLATSPFWLLLKVQRGPGGNPTQ